MKNRIRGERLMLASVLALGIVIGYWSGDDSAALAALESEVARLKTFSRNPSAIIRSNNSSSQFSVAQGDEILFSQEESDLTKELQQREARGEFILDFEWPLNRKVRDRLVSEAAEKQKEKDGDEYYSLFSQLGISGADAGRLQNHITKIHKASRELETEIMQLDSAKLSYDSQIKALLSDEEYASYVKYEKRKPASQEYERMKDYFERDGNTIQPEFETEEAIIQLIGDSQAYTEVSLHSPYSSAPEPKVGWESVINGIESQITDIRRTSDNLIEAARSAALPDEILSKVEEYYSTALVRNETKLERLRDKDHFKNLRASRGSWPPVPPP